LRWKLFALCLGEKPECHRESEFHRVEGRRAYTGR
jgi:hypothetical protein